MLILQLIPLGLFYFITTYKKEYYLEISYWNYRYLYYAIKLGCYYEDGYKESYEQNIEKALKESEEIKQEGYNTLLNIKNEANSYIKENKESIINISISIAEQVLREKFKDVKLMEAMLNNVIAEYDLKNDLVIKVNPLYKEELQKNIDEEISKNNLSQKIFIIPDLGVEEGNAVIETESGKLIVGIDSVLDKVKEELL